MDASSEIIHALLPIYLVTVLGASMLTVGLIEGIAEATASITKVFSGALSDWLGVELSPREFALLHALASRPDTAVSKDDLLRLVWGDEQAATRNVVEVYVGYVRRKLDAVGAGHVLRTVRGYGYLVGTP
jgi:DNA-binding response OmpR family regulator